MKKIYFILIILITFLTEILVSIYFIKEKTNYQNDSVNINDLSKTIEKNYPNDNEYPKEFQYTIFDENENIMYKTNNELSKSINEAYKNQDTIVDLKINEENYKLVINNNLNNIIEQNQKTYIKILIIISTIQLLSFSIYYILSNVYIIKPFKEMKDFATRISNGDLDIPLKMDKNNNFGAFTESFDIMREEIKKARTKEKKAIEAKKELVAKLSHDIKSPIASIKSSSELGLEITTDEKIKKQFSSINKKSDQINTLITNLFNSTLEELEQLNINPTKLNSAIIKELIINSDYQNKAQEFEIKECKVFADILRLQQVFDNIFINSYKYADTDIEINSYIDNEYLIINIKDFGNTITDEEIPLLLEKFKRGSNVKNKDGVGLGLYISKQFIKQMDGELEIKNDNPGFKVIIKLRII